LVSGIKNQFILDLNWSIKVPGFASLYPSHSSTPAHDAKLAQIVKKRREDSNKLLYKMQGNISLFILDDERNANELSLAFEKGQVDGESDDIGFDE
jgi:hypothetical protein